MAHELNLKLKLLMTFTKVEDTSSPFKKKKENIQTLLKMLPFDFEATQDFQQCTGAV